MINFDLMKLKISEILSQGILNPEKCKAQSVIRARYKSDQSILVKELIKQFAPYDIACFYAVLPTSMRPYLKQGLVSWAISVGFDIHSENDAALRLVCYHGDLELATALVECGANVNALYGMPILACVQSKKYDILDYLLKNGADPSIQRSLALETAIRAVDVISVEILLKAGAKVLPINLMGNKSKEMVDLLDRYKKQGGQDA